MSGGKWIKPAGDTYAPTAIVAVVAPGKPVADPDGKSHVPLSWGGASVIGSRWASGRWTYPVARDFTDPEALHDWVEGFGRVRRSLCVVAPVASDVLTLSRWWERAEAKKVRWARGAGESPNPPDSSPRPPHDDSGCDRAGSRPARSVDPPETGYIVSRMVLRGKPDIITFSVGGKSFCWLSGRQYFDQPEEDLARAVSHTWAESGPAAGPNEVVSRRPAERAKLWLTLMQSLADWWRHVDGGPWGRTLGQMGLSYFRKRLSAKTVLAHTDKYAKRLELDGLFGGRASTWYYGNVGDPATRGRCASVPPPDTTGPTIPVGMDHYDVRSMYPYLLAYNDYPVQLLTIRDNRPVESVEQLLRDYCVIARVRVRSGSGEYPYRHGDRAAYPAGEFTTTLCGPELQRAIADGCVLKAFTVATYAKGRPFGRMMDELMRLRWAAESSGNAAWGLFVKALSNSVGGKLAQRPGRWVERPGVSPEVRWGEWIGGTGTDGNSRRFRALAGLVWEHVEDELSGRPLGSCFAYLTSYGRLLMRQVRESVPARSVLSQDTDGVWVLQTRSVPSAARPACSSTPAPVLRLTGSESHGRFWGPNHFWASSGWTLAGFSHGWASSGGLSFRDAWTSNPAAGSPDRAPRHVWYHVRDTTLSVTPVDAIVQDDGWAVPCPADSLPPAAS